MAERADDIYTRRLADLETWSVACLEAAFVDLSDEATGPALRGVWESGPTAKVIASWTMARAEPGRSAIAVGMKDRLRGLIADLSPRERHPGLDTLLRQQVWNALLAECGGGDVFRAPTVAWLFADPQQPPASDRPSMGGWLMRRARAYFRGQCEDPELPWHLRALDPDTRLEALIEGFYTWWCDRGQNAEADSREFRLQGVLRTCRSALFGLLKVAVACRGHDYLDHLKSGQGEAKHPPEGHVQAEDVVWALEEMSADATPDLRNRVWSRARQMDRTLQTAIAELYYGGHECSALQEAFPQFSVGNLKVLKYRGTLRVLASFYVVLPQSRAVLNRIPEASVFEMIRLDPTVVGALEQSHLDHLTTPQPADSKTISAKRARLVAQAAEAARAAESSPTMPSERGHT